MEVVQITFEPGVLEMFVAGYAVTIVMLGFVAGSQWQ